MVDYKRVVETLRSYFKNKSFDGKRFEEARINALITEDVIASLQQDRMQLAWAQNVLKEIKDSFSHYRVEGRIKSIYSVIYKIINTDEAVETALSEGELPFSTEFKEMIFKESPMDTIGYKIICETEKQCYEVLHELSEMYQVIYFKDRIICPKQSGYRDLRIVVFMEIEDENTWLPVEFIIQSEYMYNKSNTGKQSHREVYPWKYDSELKLLSDEFQTIAL